MHFTIPATACIILFGCAYIFLRPVSKEISPFIIQVIYGMLTMSVSLILMACIEKDQFIMNWHMLDLKKLGFILGYCFCLIGGGLTYLYALHSTAVPVSILTAFTSIYPVITILLALPIFKEYLLLNWQFTVPGILFSLVGPILLAFAYNK